MIINKKIQWLQPQNLPISIFLIPNKKKKSEEAKEDRKPKSHHPDNVDQKQSLSRNRQPNAITNITSSRFRDTNAVAQSICTTAPVRNAVFSANRISPKTLNRTRSRFRRFPAEFTVGLLGRNSWLKRLPTKTAHMLTLFTSWPPPRRLEFRVVIVFYI
ncbi:hypothetical protein IGI04_011332 [Brassica rapa subsp. trilocularis]|uniref:Uncharacterized protein n=1 Tax=Brassica rapa subsp. trilocularis TaxID=1813537 RepID=A0ABQ7N2R7_BRACM|nr:hypothetical protein IGI04_011332 [Brassica rapa subsp. trilocularis]